MEKHLPSLTHNVSPSGRPADTVPSGGRPTAVASSISVQVERLSLEGFHLPSSGERQVEAAFRAERIQVLSVNEKAPGLQAGGSRRELPGGALSISQWADPEDLGRKIAHAIYKGMQL